MLTTDSSMLRDAHCAGDPDGAFRVVHVRPPGNLHAAALSEFAECVYFGLRRLGIPVTLHDKPDESPRQIVIGAHLLGGQEIELLPADAILYNSEQIDLDSVWLQGDYLPSLRNRRIWDYSSENVRRLEAAGAGRVRHVPLGYVPELARIAPGVEDIDVLFYGSLNARRRKIIEGLKSRGLKVTPLFGVYGEQRDRAISQAKVVLSLHFYEAKIFEIVRAAYLFTNAKALVAELGTGSDESDLGDAMLGVPYDSLVDACVDLVGDPNKRRALGERAHRIFARRREESILASALAAENARPNPVFPVPQLISPPVPLTLQLGSGKDFRPDCFNIDINAAWDPDATCDIADPALLGSSFQTLRFGRVTLAENTFERAIANDVLEHIPDLPTAMTNVLHLLKPGGVLDIIVPYDLSLGAWQDPTHVRAFNERSWLYYSDWHWYLGWTEARFDLIAQEFQPSALGNELQRSGKPAEEIIRTPRAVESLHVLLRKRYLQPSERQEAMRRQPGRRALSPA